MHGSKKHFTMYYKRPKKLFTLRYVVKYTAVNFFVIIFVYPQLRAATGGCAFFRFVYLNINLYQRFRTKTCTLRCCTTYTQRETKKKEKKKCFCSSRHPSSTQQHSEIKRQYDVYIPTRVCSLIPLSISHVLDAEDYPVAIGVQSRVVNFPVD